MDQSNLQPVAITTSHELSVDWYSKIRYGLCGTHPRHLEDPRLVVSEISHQERTVGQGAL